MMPKQFAIRQQWEPDVRAVETGHAATILAHLPEKRCKERCRRCSRKNTCPAAQAAGVSRPETEKKR